eukprot:CAMPEP_0180695698 /NCGR_PEP_ID=MMETSP1038_2-20121128/2586_1 /TAXON_ID=632150 /ORGANISM="Azadinium spinosum, Strain 3D9" /LENGTH=60 /DNA_ID=CAMNT_0022727131 /DNA_START=155 /DNA_END=335 /DNA_ORIENTATION=-
MWIVPVQKPPVVNWCDFACGLHLSAQPPFDTKRSGASATCEVRASCWLLGEDEDPPSEAS